MHGPRLVALAMVTACGSPALPSGQIACGPNDSCPDGMTCARDLCWSDPPGEWDAAAPDAARLDAPGSPVEHAREAEAYDQLVLLPGTAGSAAWTVENDLADASDGSYLAALPNDGTNCLDRPPTDCGAVVIYQLPQLAPGTYYLHLRTSAVTPDDDSLFYGLNGDLIDDANLPDGVAWVWSRLPLGPFDAAGQEVHLWVREDGAAVDRLVVSQSLVAPE